MITPRRGREKDDPRAREDEGSADAGEDHHQVHRVPRELVGALDEELWHGGPGLRVLL